MSRSTPLPKGKNSKRIAWFHHLCDNAHYEAAALYLFAFSQELFKQGEFRLLAELHERLIGNLADKPQLAQSNWGELGSIYGQLGELEKAIMYQQKALEITEQIGDVANEMTWRTNIGNRLFSLGRIEEAVHHYQVVLSMARQHEDRRTEIVVLLALGSCAAGVGDFSNALTFYKKVQTILETSPEIDATGLIGVLFGNMGNVYHALGNLSMAISHHDQALEGTRENAVAYSRALGNLAEALISADTFAEALTCLKEGIARDKRMGYKLGLSYKHGSLASFYLLQEDFKAALATANAAVAYHNPKNDPQIALLRGIAHLRLGETAAANADFHAANDSASKQLTLNTRNPEALITDILAHCGMGISGVNNMNESIAALQLKRLRGFCQAPGLEARMKRLLALLEPVDSIGLIAAFWSLTDNVS
ncbi:MAG TPA: tetratricopeptide repeat protein [Aggregatilineales bacterium]|nr:tetratricopeptide repeat protein [Anaerolineales bacterium]HRE47608.1 tetratricopeptide repeat protein [Aggregatilineales bacterium]